MTNRFWPQTIHHARRLVVFVVGMTLLLFGVAMLITPGPGWLLIISGLGILAIEFVWARRLLNRLKAAGHDVGRTIFNSFGKNRRT